MPIRSAKAALLLITLVFVTGCAQQPVPVSCPPFPMPPAEITTPLPASTEGNLTQHLQESFSDMLQDLRESLAKARVSVPPSLRVRNGSSSN